MSRTLKIRAEYNFKAPEGATKDQLRVFGNDLVEFLASAVREYVRELNGETDLGEDEVKQIMEFLRKEGYPA
jgi:hypothetical protein